MIKEQEILDLGFRIFGLEEDDPYYKIIFSNRIFGVYELSGNFDQDGKFEIFSMDKKFSDINELKQLFIINGFVIDVDMMNRYGSSEPIRNEPYSDSDNNKSMNEFIVDLLSISDDKKKLPVVIQAPNQELFSPRIKMIKKNDELFGEVEKMIITY